MHIIKHAKGAPGLRLMGLGPNFKPTKGIKKLQKLFNKNTFWAVKRNSTNIRKMLANSSRVVTIWDHQELIGFGRVTSDSIYRAVIWDVVVDKKHQGAGIGTLVIEEILRMKELRNVDKIYLMTSNQTEFYLQMGFKIEHRQNLMVQEKFKCDLNVLR
tara:strand:+ start:156 stop:629 length:474 start_codon:yes stop_codon:yes gene_type:complete